MNITGKIALLLLLATIIRGQDLKSGYNPSSLEELRTQIDDIVEDGNFKHAFWGIEVRSLKNDEIIYKKNSEKSFVPASAIKLFTTSACFLLLGPDFHYSTEFYTSEEGKQGEVDDLIIKASGDPTFSLGVQDSETLFHPLPEISDSLKKYGIKSVNRKLLADNRIFDNIYYGEGWELSTLYNWYAPPVSPLSLDGNIVKITVTPSKFNFPAEITIGNEFSGISIINKVVTISADSRINSWIELKRDNDNLVTVYGEIKENNEPVTDFVPVYNPSSFFMESLKKSLEENGITVGAFAANPELELEKINFDKLLYQFSIDSESYIKIAKEINKNSNNFLAEVALKTLGVEIYGNGTSEAGLEAVADVMKNMGINTNNLQIVDGSGLSRHNLVTPRQVVKLLSYMYKSSEFEHFYGSLPIGGVDGTLSGRMKNTSAENNVRAKPGYLEGVRTLSGYLKTRDDEPLAFSIMLNNYYVASNLANYMFDLICSRLANFSRNLN